MPRASIKNFELANPIYRGASVTFYTVAGGAKTATKATLYAGSSGAAQLSNPVKLDSFGKFRQAVYIDVPVIGTVEGLTVPTHDTGIVSPAPSFRGNPSTGEIEYSYDAGVSWSGTGEFIAPSWVNVQDVPFNAVGDGVTDDTAAIIAAYAAAAAAGAPLYFPAGIYKTSGTLTWDQRVDVIGVPDRSVIKPAAGVTTAVIFNPPLNPDVGNVGYGTSIFGIYIDGVNTTNCTGLAIGTGVLHSRIRVERVVVCRFLGATGVGMKLKHTVETVFEDCLFSHNGTNAIIGADVDPVLPTVTRFRSTLFRSATLKGVQIHSGYDIDFDAGCVYEGNGEHGMYVVNGLNQNILMVTIRGWFEANWASLAGAAREAQFHLYANGVLNLGTCQASVRVPCWFLSGTGEADCINFVRNTDFVIDNPKCSSARAAGVLIENACNGYIMNWDRNNSGAYSSTVSISASPSVFNYGQKIEDQEAQWTDYVPVLTPFGAMTFTGVTIHSARFKLVGKTLFLRLHVTGTTGGVASPGIVCTLPGLAAPKSTNLRMAAAIVQNNVWEPGMIQTGAADGIYFRRNADANYGLTANTGFSFEGVLEIV
jgi:hypothetical protein